MATKAPITDAWITHSGNGCPVAIGTLVEVEMFNGVRKTIAAGTSTHDLDGTTVPRSRSAGWSAWDFNDGGPMAPKFKAYRLIVNNERGERNATMFRSWLRVRQKEHAPCVIEDALGAALEDAQ